MQNLDRVKQQARDLRKEEPRPAWEPLGGETYAARCLDKCRAALLGWGGDYQFGCPMDEHFLAETRIPRDEFQTFVATGADDNEVAQWIRIHVRRK